MRTSFAASLSLASSCWSDGNTLLPVSHTLLFTENTKNRLREAPRKVDARSNGGKQRKLAQQKATEVMLQLLQEAKAADIPARHVLFDTWFCSPASLLKIHGLGYDVVAMAKKTEKIHYLHQGCLQDVCFVEAMCLLLLLFVERLQEKPMLDEGEIQGQLQGFLKELPVLLSQKLRKCA